MIFIYTTLNNTNEARKISHKLLEKNLTNCVNFFPITCIYNYQNKITEEPEIVLIIKTIKTKFSKIEKLIKSEINYDNFIGQIDITHVNSNFQSWLNCTIK